MSTPHALIVDDEPDIRELLEMTLDSMGLAVTSAASLREAQQRLADAHFDLCFTDMRLPDGNGITLVQAINRDHPFVPVAVITAYGSAESAVEALKAGAFDFVSKPVNLEILRNLVNAALKLNPPEDEKAPDARPQLLGDSQPMREVRRTIAKLARSQAPVYLSGESGVGKELAARLIHAQGPRAAGPFVPVNCGAIPTELMESEFFGHKRGSFTGATSDKEGLLQTAKGGTLLLDEIAELPMHMQVKLLRVIQEKSVRPIGAKHEQALDVRIISSTHKDLGELVERGDFRQDLYYRINVIQLHLPSLRERPEDIPELAEHLLGGIATEWGMDRPTLSREALDKLQGYSFPGNVRELQNILERAVTLCEDKTIHAEDLQLASPSAKVSAPSDAAPQPGQVPLEEYIGNVERDMIVKALEETRYNKTAAAKKLGITFRALRYKIKKLGLE